MATIAKLDILIGANTQRMTKGFKTAEGKAKGFSSSLGKLGGRLGALSARAAALGPIGVAIAAITAAATLSVLAIRRTIKEIDELAKTASKLGTTTEALSALQHGAELSGVATNTMNMALQRMTRRMSEAAHGAGEAKAAIKELGLDAQRLAGMSPDKALERVADAMQKVKNPSDRLRLAFKLFDSEGVAMVNMLRNGSAGLKEFQTNAERLGIVIDSAGAVQVERATEAFAEFKAALSGVATQLTIALAPALEVAAKLLTDTVVIAVDAAKIMRKGFDWLFGVPPAAAKAKQSLGELEGQMARTEAIEKMVAGLQQQIDLFGKSAGAAAEFKAKLQGATEAQIEQIRRLGEAMEQQKASASQEKVIADLKTQIVLFGMAADQAAIYKATVAGASEQQAKAIGALTAKLEGLKTAQEATAEAERAQQSMIERGKALREEMLSPMDRHQKMLNDLNRLYRVGAIDLRTYQKQVAKSRAELVKFQDQGKDALIGVALKGSREAAEAIARARQDAAKDRALADAAKADLANIPARRLPPQPEPIRITPSPMRPALPPLPDFDPLNALDPDFVPLPDIELTLPPPVMPSTTRIPPPLPDFDPLNVFDPDFVPLPDFDPLDPRDPDFMGGGTGDDREQTGIEVLEKFAAAAPRDNEERNKRLDDLATKTDETNALLNQLLAASQRQQQPKVFKV